MLCSQICRRSRSRRWALSLVLASTALVHFDASAQAEPLAGFDPDEPLTAQAESSTRATVVDLPPAAEDRGIVRLSTAATAEDVIQPVLEIERGKTVLLKPSYQVKRIAVGDPEIVDFVINGASEIQLIARAVGNTNVLIWDSQNRLQASIDIHVGAVRAQLVRELQRVLGRNDVNVDMAGDAVVLRGTVPSLETSEAAGIVAKAFFAGEGEGQGARVINLLSVGGNQQVMLEVKIAEMSRSIRRSLGTNLQALFGKGGEQLALFTLTRNLTMPTLSSSLQSPMTTMGMMTNNLNVTTTFSNQVRLIGRLINRDSLALTAFIDLMETEQLGKVLAEPTLVARSGELASFLAGGEIPIPVPQGDGTISISFKRFGVQLEFIPTVLSADRIHLQVTPEVSQPDFTTGAVQAGGLSVPSFRTRRASTGIELADGQSFAIGGLLQDNISASYEQYPFLGDIPILGNLFRSQQFQRDETELVIIVTPRLVQPLGPDPIPLPTDAYFVPSRLAFYALGRIQGKPIPPGTNPYSTGSSDDPNQPGDSGLIGDFGHRLPIPQPVGDGL